MCIGLAERDFILRNVACEHFEVACAPAWARGVDVAKG